jgi:DNA-binding transcriptional LysR family regulator
MDKFLAMQTFVRVVEAGTFTKAAESMNLPKPTVTRLIQTLETELQTKLLHRTTRRVSVTPDGAAYYDRATRLLSELDELESSMSHAKATPRGRLRVDVPASLGMSVIIPALPDFHARYPDIQLDLGVSDRPVDMIGENVDCVVRGGELSDTSLVARRIGDVYLVMCATPDYLQRHGVPKHPLDLEENHTLVRYRMPLSGQLKPMSLSNGQETHEVQGRHVISLNDANAYVTAGLAGLGVMQALTFLVQNHISSGALEPFMLDWCSGPVPVYIVYPPNRHLSNKLRVFVDWIVELFATHDLIQQKCSLRTMAS